VGVVNIKALDDKMLQFELPPNVSSTDVLKQLAHISAKEWALVARGTRAAVCAGAIADELVEYNRKLQPQETGGTNVG